MMPTVILALADLRRDWVLSLCQILVLAAVLTPLLVLVGLDRGVVGRMLADLREDPAMREIGPRVTGVNRFSEAWLAGVRARPDVEFVVGDARALAAEVEATAAGDGAPVIVTLVPTAADDPLRAQASAWAAGRQSVVLSAAAARELDARVGTLVTLLIPRRRDDRDESQLLRVRVAAVLPERMMEEGRRAILADAALVFAVQQYRDGYALPGLGWPGEPTLAAAPHYERFRLYARTIGDVAQLHDWLLGQGIEAVSRLGDIAPVIALDHSLTRVLVIIVAFASAGLAGAIAATQWSGVRRRKRELALLALVGYGRGALLWIVLFQALVLTILGTVAGLVLFKLAAISIDLAFAAVPGREGPACILRASDMLAASVVTLLVAMAAASLASWQVAGIEPAQAVRDV